MQQKVILDLLFKLSWKITQDMLCICAAMDIEHHQYLCDTLFYKLALKITGGML
jgi:hypothetical protein